MRWLEAELPGARAAFTTRLGGVSSAPYDSLNLALLTGDGRRDVRENRARLAAALGLGADRVLMGRQVHGARVLRHVAPPRPNPFASPGTEPDEADGEVAERPGLAPLVMVADCFPVAVVGPRGVAMLHCGWRGMTAGIVAAGVRAVEGRFAAIGPGIGPCCYEVGDQVRGRFAPLGDEVSRGRRLDLREAARRLLLEQGVERVTASDLCVSCHPKLFFSHRRDGERTGRQAGIAWLER